MKSQSAPEATSTLLADPRRLLAVAVGLPVVIFVVDQFAIEASKSDPLAQTLLPFLFVAQVGVLATCAGRFVDNVLLRCIVFAWSIMLVDAVACTTLFFGHGNTSQYIAFALFSGQIGLLTIWGMMSRMSWPVRLPIFFVSISLVVIGLMGSSGKSYWRNEYAAWAIILAMQSGVIVGICSILRVRRYSLWPTIADPRDPAVDQREQFQFSIKHIIFWTTAVCPILVLAKGIHWLLPTFVEAFWAIVLGTAMAVVSWVAMLSALGSSPRVIRFLTLCAVPPIVGVLLSWAISQSTMSWNSGRQGWLYFEFREFGFGWVLWCVLAAWFLAALLLVFRAAGYRIMRVRPRTSV